MPDETVGDKPAESADSGDGSAQVPEEKAEKQQKKGAEGGNPSKNSAQDAKGARNPAPRKQAATGRPEVKRLAKSVGMALPSNAYRVFLGRGAIPPVSEKKHFVARLKKLDRLEVTILEGDEDEADKNGYLGEIGLSNIKLREDGRSEVEIDFSLNDRGMLTVTLLDRISGTESMGRFILHQFHTELGDEVNLGSLPIEELSQKIDLLEQQMQLLKGELKVRGERE